MKFQKTLAIANVNDVDSTRVALLLKFIVFEVP
jgi:ABC-type transporter Mla MlaB component